MLCWSCFNCPFTLFTFERKIFVRNHHVRRNREQFSVWDRQQTSQNTYLTSHQQVTNLQDEEENFQRFFFGQITTGVVFYGSSCLCQNKSNFLWFLVNQHQLWKNSQIPVVVFKPCGFHKMFKDKRRKKRKYTENIWRTIPLLSINSILV